MAVLLYRSPHAVDHSAKAELGTGMNNNSKEAGVCNKRSFRINYQGSKQALY